jgi:hypothetical protein
VRSNIALNPAALAVVQVAFDEAVSSSLPAHERTQDGKTLLGFAYSRSGGMWGSATQFVCGMLPWLA